MFDHNENRVGNTTRSRVFFDEFRDVRKCNETLSCVFDISSPSKPKLRRKRRKKIVKKSMVNRIRYPKTVMVMISFV